MDGRSQSRAEGERDRDAGHRDQHRRAAVVANVAALELQPDQEEQEDQPELRDDREDLGDECIGKGLIDSLQLGTEQRVEEIGSEPAEQ